MIQTASMELEPGVSNRTALADGEQPARALRTKHSTRVLIVESDERFSRLLRRRLQSADVHVEFARTAAQAYRIHRAAPFSLIVTNVDLPGESGWLVAAKLGVVLGFRVWTYARQRVLYGEALAEVVAAQGFISSKPHSELLVEQIGSTVERELVRSSRVSA